MGPGGVVWGKNRIQKVSWDCPFKICKYCAFLCNLVSLLLFFCLDVTVVHLPLLPLLHPDQNWARWGSCIKTATGCIVRTSRNNHSDVFLFIYHNDVVVDYFFLKFHLSVGSIHGNKYSYSYFIQGSKEYHCGLIFAAVPYLSMWDCKSRHGYGIQVYRAHA